MKKLILIFLTLISSFITYSDVISNQESFIKVAEKVMPAVVNISTEKTIKQGEYESYGNLFDDPFFKRFFDAPQRRTLPQRKANALGSGFVISKDGYILTNNHVVEGADKIEVKFTDKTSYEAEIIGTDPDTDVAVLKIKSNKKDFNFLEFANSDNIKIGQWAIAIGNPFGLNSTMTVGIISAKGRSGMGIENYENFIQTDASINPGNSGGPLVNINGDVIGINTAILSKTGGNMGIGFAIPINMANSIKNSLIDTGKVERGWLGISIQPLDSNLSKKFAYKRNYGALVGDILEGTPAEKSGLKRGDIIFEINGKKIDDSNDLKHKIANIPPNTNIKLKLFRKKKEIEVNVKLGKKESTYLSITSKNELEILGMKLKTLDEELNSKFGYNKNQKGIIVLELSYSSNAASLGVKPGDVILEINNTEVSDLDKFKRIYDSIKTGDDILLYVIGKNSSRYLIINKD